MTQAGSRGACLSEPSPSSSDEKATNVCWGAAAWAFILALGIVDWLWAARAGILFVGWIKVAVGLIVLESISIFYRVSGRSDSSGKSFSSSLADRGMGTILDQTGRV